MLFGNQPVLVSAGSHRPDTVCGIDAYMAKKKRCRKCGATKVLE